MTLKPKMLITGSGGLVGSEAVRYFSKKYDVFGIDNNQRQLLFGKEASVSANIDNLKTIPNYTHYHCSLLDDALIQIVKDLCPDVVIHTASQPSHDWAVKNPTLDFDINTVGTFKLLEAVRLYSPESVFIFTSTNKVYGSTPNILPLLEEETRYDLPKFQEFYNGVTEQMSIDQTTHSLFGVSKTAADLYVQEYGKYFGMYTVAFRFGCITGNEHRGVPLHGFLSYLTKCYKSQNEYEIIGYKGKQVRDNIHSLDVVNAFETFIENPMKGVMYNLGGGRTNSCSVLEAIDLCEQISGYDMKYRINDTARIGDHKWWITSNKSFEKVYPNWKLQYTLEDIVKELLYE